MIFLISLINKPLILNQISNRIIFGIHSIQIQLILIKILIKIGVISNLLIQILINNNLKIKQINLIYSGIIKPI